MRGRRLDIPCVQKDWILEQHDDLIVLLGQHSDVGKMLMTSDPRKSRAFTGKMDFKNLAIVFISALTRTNRSGEEDFIQEAVKLAKKYNIGVVAHNDVHFITAEDLKHMKHACMYCRWLCCRERPVSP